MLSADDLHILCARLEIPDCACPILWGKRCTCPVALVEDALRRRLIRFDRVEVVKVENESDDPYAVSFARDAATLIQIHLSPRNVYSEIARALKIARAVDLSCDCPDVILSPPCPHVKASAHRLPLGEWERLLRLAEPGEYEDPPAAFPVFGVLTRQAREAILIQRADAGVSLFCLDDEWNEYGKAERLKVSSLSEREEDGGKVAGRLMNGRTNPVESTVAG